jgi:AcrR family transcriptional regulator
MAGRPRTVSDADILEATERAISRVGAGRLTLAQVAVEAGLAAPTLVQRFGSKRGLLLAFARQGPLAARAYFDAVRRHPSPVDALLAALSGMADRVASPEALANHLTVLSLDLSDPEFHALALEHAGTVRGELQALLAAAVQAGELRPLDAGRLATALQVAYNGALVTWAIHRQGRLDDWIRGQAELLLEPHRAATARLSRGGIRPRERRPG